MILGPEGKSPPASSLQERLFAFAERHRLALLPEQVEALVRLDALVERWGQAVSLFGFSNEAERHDRYFLESLHASRWLPGQGESIDVGSGGGMPALPMAVVRPGLHWSLLEPNHRKAIFLEEAIGELGLKHAKVVRVRLEDYQPPLVVRAITTRGVAWGSEFFRRVRPWFAPEGRLLVFTGSKRAGELRSELGSGWQVRSVERLAPRHDVHLLVAERPPERFT